MKSKKLSLAAIVLSFLSSCSVKASLIQESIQLEEKNQRPSSYNEFLQFRGTFIENPEELNYLLNEARQVKIKGNLDQAIEKYSQALIYQDDTFQALRGLMLCYKEKKNWVEFFKWGSLTLQLASFSFIISHIELTSTDDRLSRTDNYQATPDFKKFKNKFSFIHTIIGLLNHPQAQYEAYQAVIATSDPSNFNAQLPSSQKRKQKRLVQSRQLTKLASRTPSVSFDSFLSLIEENILQEKMLDTDEIHKFTKQEFYLTPEEQRNKAEFIEYFSWVADSFLLLKAEHYALQMNRYPSFIRKLMTSDHVYAHVLLSRYFMKEKNYLRAHEQLKKIQNRVNLEALPPLQSNKFARIDLSVTYHELAQLYFIYNPEAPNELPNYEVSLSYLEKCATLYNYPDSYISLGDLYRRGLGCEQNFQKAFECYKKSFQLTLGSSGGAAYKLAKCYEAGVGTKESPAMAELYYKKAIELGEDAYSDLVDLYLKTGKTYEDETVMKYLQEGAERDNPYNKVKLAQAYLKKGDYKQARTVLKKLKKQESTEAEWLIGQIYFYADNNIKEALAIAEKTLNLDLRHISIERSRVFDLLLMYLNKKCLKHVTPEIRLKRIEELKGKLNSLYFPYTSKYSFDREGELSYYKAIIAFEEEDYEKAFDFVKEALLAGYEDSHHLLEKVQEIETISHEQMDEKEHLESELEMSQESSDSSQESDLILSSGPLSSLKEKKPSFKKENREKKRKREENQAIKVRKKRQEHIAKVKQAIEEERLASLSKIKLSFPSQALPLLFLNREIKEEFESVQNTVALKQCLEAAQSKEAGKKLKIIKHYYQDVANKLENIVSSQGHPINDILKATLRKAIENGKIYSQRLSRKDRFVHIIIPSQAILIINIFDHYKGQE